jgi:O-antigen/teichoic acid export membrane protein
MRPSTARDYDEKLARGARWNVLGTFAKLLHPLYLLVVARLYGPEVLGLYLVAISLVELATSIVGGGVKDGIVMFGGRGDHVRDENHRAALYRVLATSLLVVAVCTAVVASGVALAGPGLVDSLFSYDATADAMGDELGAILPLLVWTLPCMALMELGVAATKSLMRMEYDTLIVGFLRPALLLVSAIAAWFFAPDLQGLLTAYLACHALLAVVAVWAFMRHFSLRELARALVRLEIDRALLAFALPQSLNLTLNNFIVNVDKLMLGYFGVAPELIGFYGIAATVVRNVRHARLAFSGAFSPIIARLHAEGRTAELEENFGVVARWALTIAIPMLVIMLGLRQEVLLLFHASFTHDAAFMVLLAVQPLVSCWVGLAGNIVVMTGHSRWNLFNSLVVGAMNAVLNAVWIPAYGLWGAALATAVSTIAVSLLQLVEAKLLVGVGARLDLVRKPLLAGVAAVLVLIVATMAGDGALVRAGAAIVAVVVYGLALRFMGIDPRDRDLLRFRKPRLTAPAV